MKRFTALLLLLCLLPSLFACQPTPEQEIITPHGNDNILGLPEAENTKAPAGTTPAPVVKIDIPEHVVIDEEPQHNVFVKADVDVTAERTAALPQYEATGLSTWEKDPAFLKRVLRYLGCDGEAYLPWDDDYLTKSDLADRIAALIRKKEELEARESEWDYIDRDDYEVNEGNIAALLKSYETAPEEYEKTPYDWSKGFETETSRDYYVAYRDGSGYAYIRLGGDNGCEIWTDYRLPAFRLEGGESQAFIDSLHLSDPTITREQAVEQADAFISAIGFECNLLTSVVPAFAENAITLEPAESVWTVRYTRKIGSLHTVERNATNIRYGYRDPQSMLPSPWGSPECIEITVGGNGIVAVKWSGLCTLSEKVADDTQLMDFDKLVKKIVDRLGFQFAMITADQQVDEHGNPRTRTLDIISIELVYSLVCKKDHPEVGVYAPVWCVRYKEREDINESLLEMFFSAVDGSVYDPFCSWTGLMASLNPTTPKPEKPGR